VSFFRRIRRWSELPSSERNATLAVASLVPVISVSLFAIGFRRTVQWVQQTAARGARAETNDNSVIVEEGIAALKRVKRYTPWSGRCLARSLGLWWLLRRRGVTASLHLGVRIKDKQLDAHAWVTHADRVLADSDSVWKEFPGRFASDDLAFTEDRSR
jgi:hypothetical protein